MKPNNKTEASRWIRQAQHDFGVAKGLFEDSFWSDCCFVSQQVAEKTLKAYLFYKGIRPGTPEVLTHSVFELAAYGKKNDKNFPDIPGTKDIDKFYIPTRYPDALPGGAPFEMYEKKDAELALRIAEDILTRIKTLVKI